MATNGQIGISTIDRPIKFFSDFYEKNYLVTLRQNWLPKHPDHWINNYHIYDVDIKKEKYTVEYEVEISGHEENEDKEDRYSHWVVDKTEWQTKTYFFADFLNNLFLQEYRKSVELIEDAIALKSNISKAKLFCVTILDSLRLYLRKSNSEQFIKYIECARPVEALIRYLLTKHHSLCPNFKRDKQLVQIVCKKWDQIASIKSLDPRIFLIIVELTDRNENYLIEYDTSDSKEIFELKKALKHICDGNSHLIKTELHFNWDAGPVSYLFRKLKEYNDKLELNDIAKSKKVFIKKNPFIAANSSTAATRFEENNGPKNYLKGVIDSLFLDHLL